MIQLCLGVQQVATRISGSLLKMTDGKNTFDDNSIEFEDTSVEELQLLAASLLQSPDAGMLIREAGMYGDFTPAQEQVIELQIEEYSKAQGWGPRDPLLLALSITLGRWVAEGKISATDEPDATAFLEDRHFHRTGPCSGLQTRKPFPSEVVLVAKDLREIPEFWAAFVQAGEDGDIDETYWREALRPIYERVCFKYGLQNRGMLIVFVQSILRQLAIGNVPDLSHPKAIAFISRNKIFVREEDVS